MKYQQGDYFFTNWGCDFGRGTFAFYPIYHQLKNDQKPGDGCKTGTDSTYTSLCSSKEEIDVNSRNYSEFDWDKYHQIYN